jgi:hypothetical protein
MTGFDSPQAIMIWLGALATLMLYSLLYRENPVYRFAEHAFLGLATGYGLYAVWGQILYPKWWQPIVGTPGAPPGDPAAGGVWPWALAIVPGLMYYTIYSRRLNWMSRVVMMTMMGFAAGLFFREWAGRYMPQIANSFRPLFSQVPPFVEINNVIFLVALVSVMTYFFFSFEHRSRPVRRTADLGRWLMMIAFGAMFGSTVMARLSLFIGRLWFLFAEWIHLIPRA